MARNTQKDLITYKELTKEVEQPGWYCVSCEEVLLDEADVLVTEAAFFDLKAEAEGLLPADEILRIRRRLKLSQRKAGELLGGGPRAFQKYEKRLVMVSKPMSNLLRVLDRHPEVLDDLALSSKPGYHPELCV